MLKKEKKKVLDFLGGNTVMSKAAVYAPGSSENLGLEEFSQKPKRQICKFLF